MRVVHVINDLGAGGAQALLRGLVAELETRDIRNEVVTLLDSDEVIAGRRTLSLSATSGFGPVGAALKLSRLMRAHPATVLHTWLPQSDLLAGLTGRLVGVPVVWSIHRTPLDEQIRSWRYRLVERAWLAGARRIPTHIISCASSSMAIYGSNGLPLDRSSWIPNGVAPDRYVVPSSTRARVRVELQIPEDAPAIGMLARVHPQKDHSTFLHAAADLLRRRGRIGPSPVFVLAGAGTDAGSLGQSLWRQIDDLGLRPRIRLLGEREDIPCLLAALDVVTLSARSGEAFPLVLVEGLMAGRICVATDCGDSRWILGDEGVVPPADFEALAAAWDEALRLTPEQRAVRMQRGRERVLATCALDATARAYESVYRQVLERSQRSGRGKVHAYSLERVEGHE